MFLKALFFAGLAIAKVQFMGMNIAGFEFGCLIDGTCPTSSAQPPLADGPGQMQHFATDNQMNIFRLPVSWQFLLNNKLGGTLDDSNTARYDQLMQACLATGAYCAIDIHNFARWNGKIIGQAGGPTDEQFSDLWTQLATKYKSNDKVIFGLMNEPHDIDISAWATSCQAAVTAIRNTGASSQMILLPGNDFTSAGKFVENGSGAALIGIKNPDGSIDGLIFDIHKYLDVDNSGNLDECTTDNIEAFTSVAQFLRENGRQGLVSETGAGSTDSCFTAFCAQNSFINQNSDVYLGIVAWAAGSFSNSYTLSLTPSKKNGKFVNNKLADQCVVSVWENAATAVVTSAIASVTSSIVASTTAAGISSATTTTGSANTKPESSSSRSLATINPGDSASKTGLIQDPSVTSAVPSSSFVAVASTSSLVASTSLTNMLGSNVTASGAATGNPTAPASPSVQISSGAATQAASSFVLGACGFVFACLL
ncbi:glycoside hydrolase superfamily [Amylocarpus encephaloides]|uniref:Endoglucanase EG-II n=1 Tax=Amylocarpus encephaloides TaxID=45428 RepID=A0A9P7Y842_9HELO|nr:glycoside hydrolase superfamily [Amylocarpus encephaloides]